MSLQNRIDEAVSPRVGHPTELPNAAHPQSGLVRGNSLLRAILAVAQEPMAVLDGSLSVIAASRSYYRLFPAGYSEAQLRPFCEPVAPRWNAFVLQTLTDVHANNIAADDTEVEIDVPQLGPHRMLLNARSVSDREFPNAALLVGLKDLSSLDEANRLKETLAEQLAVCLREAHHRISNSLQIIASIILLKARGVTSEETRGHLRDVHKRLILVAAVQRQLCSDGMTDEVEFGPYVAQLSAGLAKSMTDEDSKVTIFTSASKGKIKTDDAVSFGLIITELVINALKHGFPAGRPGRIDVDFVADGPDWRLTISDNGVGRPKDSTPGRAGLGTNIVEALARQLKARVEIDLDRIGGSSTSIVHAEAGRTAEPH